jgi:hypothetical protein
MQEIQKYPHITISKSTHNKVNVLKIYANDFLPYLYFLVMSLLRAVRTPFSHYCSFSSSFCRTLPYFVVMTFNLDPLFGFTFHFNPKFNLSNSLKNF